MIIIWVYSIFTPFVQEGGPMPEKVVIFGKDTWPYTTEAREAFKKQGRNVEYHNVLSDKTQMERMLTCSKGDRKVPVILDQGKVIIGYNGKGWKI